MRSERPKVLHEVAGRPLLGWLVAVAREAGCDPVCVVVGHGAAAVRDRFAGAGLRWVEQRPQRGTGHALAQAADAVADAGLLLVLSGDVPMVRAATLERLVAAAGEGWGAMAVAELDEPGALGRVVARDDGTLERIVEAADASTDEREIRRVNAGIYALPAPEIFSLLEAVEPAGPKGELYLTDAVTEAAQRHPVVLVDLADATEALGVNSRAELARAQAVALERRAAELMEAGVTLVDPRRVTLEVGSEVGRDSLLHPGVALLGDTRVGERCILHQGAWLRNARVGDGAVVGSYAVLDGVEVAPGETVPVASVRRPAN